MSSSLQTELLGNKLISYFIEWCETPFVGTPGVAYTDCVIVYDVEGKPVTFLKDRSAHHNIYLGIRSNVLLGVDPVLKAAVQRVQQVYSQTFWAIPQSFRFGQACQALAKRGKNIDCLTLYWGPGGVGLSLYSAHLAAALQYFAHGIFCSNNIIAR